MAISCEPNDLAVSMACYQCIDPGRKIDALIALLQDIAGTSYTPDELLVLGKCYRCMDEARKWEIIVALLCVVANNGIGGDGDVVGGEGDVLIGAE